MLLYYVYKIWDILLIKSTEVIPHLNIKDNLPNYHDSWRTFCRGIGLFLPLSDLSKLFYILITYQLIRIACSLRKGGKQIV